MFGSGSSRSWCKTHLISESISDEILDAEYYTLREDAVANSTNDFPKVLLINYSGANNTGAEARLITLIDELREVFGPGVHITVPTLNENNLKRYIREGEKLKISHIPTFFLQAIQQMVKDSDIVVLMEGSCYMDSWASSMLWLFLWATRCAHAEGKPSIAYAVDAGRLSRLSKWLVKREASKTNLIVMRNRQSADLLRGLGVTAPIEVTADAAFNFKADPADTNILSRIWPGPDAGIVGIAPVDFYLWPVVIRPWGKSADCYKWPLYYSRSEKRKRETEHLVAGLAAQADRIVERGMRVALIGMEGLDRPICESVLAHMIHPEGARVFSSMDYSASQMTSILRSLDLLVASRYHAAVLSMASSVPMVAIGHDSRLRFLYEEAGLKGFYISYADPELFKKLSIHVDRLLSDPECVRGIIARSHEEQQTRASYTKELLRELASNHELVTKQ